MLDGGTVLVAEASPTAYKELARAKVLDGQCWTMPVVANGRLYAAIMPATWCASAYNERTLFLRPGQGRGLVGRQGEMDLSVPRHVARLGYLALLPRHVGASQRPLPRGKGNVHVDLRRIERPFPSRPDAK